jgi:WD40 repeat protein
VVYDLEELSRPVFSQQAHINIINAIDGCGGPGSVGHGAPELVTGGRDGCVRLWDPRVPEPVLALEPGPGQATRDCWTVCFGDSSSDEERCLCAGYDNGDVKVFDLRAGTMRYETNVGNGVTCVEFDRKDIEMNKLGVATLESRFRLFDMRTQHPAQGFSCLQEKAHKATVWLVRHLPQNRDLFMYSTTHLSPLTPLPP